MVIVLLKKVIYSNMQIFKNFPWHIQVYIVLTGTLFTGWLSCIQRSEENIHVIFLTYQQQTHHTFHWIQIFYINFHSNQLQLNQQDNKKMYYVLYIRRYQIFKLCFFRSLQDAPNVTDGPKSWRGELIDMYVVCCMCRWVGSGTGLGTASLVGNGQE